MALCSGTRPQEGWAEPDGGWGSLEPRLRPLSQSAPLWSWSIIAPDGQGDWVRVGQRLPHGHSRRHSSARLCPWFASWALFTVASPHPASQRAGRQRPCLQADASPPRDPRLQPHLVPSQDGLQSQALSVHGSRPGPSSVSLGTCPCLTSLDQSLTAEHRTLRHHMRASHVKR